MFDNLDLFNKHQMEEDERIAKLPECSECGQPIQDEQAYYISGEYICKDCMDYYLVTIESEEW